MVETHPSVVAILAANTRLRETDMVRLAAFRTQHPYALWAVVLQSRWLASQRLVEAVLLNPACLDWMWLCLLPLATNAAALRAVRTRRIEQDILEAVRPIQAGHLSDEVSERARRRAPAVVAPIFEVDERLDDVEIDLLGAAAAAIEQSDSTDEPPVRETASDDLGEHTAPVNDDDLEDAANKLVDELLIEVREPKDVSPLLAPQADA